MSVIIPYENARHIPPVEWHHHARTWCREHRMKQPVVYSDEYKRWLIFRYQDVLHVYKQPELYSSSLLPSANVPVKIPNQMTGIVQLDPPQHQRWRLLEQKALAACSLAQLRPYIIQVTSERLKKIQKQGQADFMTELAIPLPLLVMTKWLGLPPEQWPLFHAWVDSLILVEKEENREKVQREVEVCFQIIFKQRQQHPRQDLISHLLTSSVEGPPLTIQDLLFLATELLVAGTFSSTALLGNMLLCLELFPQELVRLRRHPDLVQNTCEEVLRYMGAARVVEHHLMHCRIATEESQLGGQRIRKGEILRPIVFSANYDEAIFDHAECFSIQRSPNPHLAFGSGIHSCLGGQLMRLEARIVLEQMLEHFHEWEIMNPQCLEQLDTEMIFGLKSLPMRF
ncbi:cytochrome P450 [Ktedonospora formicarum]|uniref:Putative cytochrome P450 YjiB n=1 Tax=Ktedonospora formicarum TaxID=2778364 RepID=A0A8J3IEY9_9CHLR|nr:cytochrome P450 [Ktedonospora formicarum]GHO51138.1 putative cytochrome P450 YjiB [Ktedonospora formicarum]